jgi:beta-N-acetylhexosaminidase
MANELLSTGIDFSFAPVLDVDQGGSQIIGDRSFSNEAAVVCELAAAYIKGMNRAGMVAIGKHFPGHGFVAADSHSELPIDNRDFQAIWQTDLLPYIKLIKVLKGVMVAHIIYKKVDGKPASFSSYWLKKVLREQLQFQGAIFSDDLNMAGANYGGDFVNRAKLTLTAGCDMILICNNREAAITVLDNLQSYQSKPSQTRLRLMHAHTKG